MTTSISFIYLYRQIKQLKINIRGSKLGKVNCNVEGKKKLKLTTKLTLLENMNHF